MWKIGNSTTYNRYIKMVDIALYGIVQDPKEFVVMIRCPTKQLFTCAAGNLSCGKTCCSSSPSPSCQKADETGTRKTIFFT